MFEKYLTAIFEDKGYTPGEFTVGFEFEAFIPFEDEMRRRYTKVSKFYSNCANDYFEWSKEFFTSRGYKMIKNYIGSDCTIESYKYNDYAAFELQSPVFPCTPKAMGDIIEFFRQSRNTWNTTTNESCAMHVHIGMPNKQFDVLDRSWIVLQTIFNKKLNLLQEFTEFKTYNLTSDEWANTEHLDNIYNALNGQSKESLFNIMYEILYKSVKESVLNSHYQGTLEWRGPRSFFDSKDFNDTKEFFLNLPKLINKLSQALDERQVQIGDVIITKQEFEKNSPSFGRAAQKTKKRMARTELFDWNKQDPKIVPEAIKNIPWLKGTTKNGIAVSKESNGSYVIQGGSLTNSPTPITGIRLENVDVINCNAENITIDSCLIKDAIITKCKLKSCYFTGSATISDSVLARMRIRYDDAKIVIQNSKLDVINAYRTTFNNCEMKQGFLHDSTINGGIYSDCSFERCKISKDTQLINCKKD